MLVSAKADADNMQRGDDMSIGKVIRKYRKLRNMTQEEMAARLGVTAPAVNKWENENSCPDVTLLAPIARLLGITTDTLLSFREELSKEEVVRIIQEMDAMLKEKPYDEAFQWAKAKLEQYPNCHSLILQTALLLDGKRLMQPVPDSKKYDGYICSLYIRVLDSTDETLRISAADALTGFYMRQEKYEEAEKYLNYLSVQNPERKRKQAQIYGKTGRIREAYRAYEELLYTDYQRVSAELYGMYTLAIQEGDMKRARMLAEKQSDIARCFDMGKYYEASSRLDIAAVEKDRDTVAEIAAEMLSNIEKIDSFKNAPLYEHLEFKEPEKEFTAVMKENLLNCFRNDEAYGFMKDDGRWRELIEKE